MEKKNQQKNKQTVVWLFVPPPPCFFFGFCLFVCFCLFGIVWDCLVFVFVSLSAQSPFLFLCFVFFIFSPLLAFVACLCGNRLCVWLCVCLVVCVWCVVQNQQKNVFCVCFLILHTTESNCVTARIAHARMCLRERRSSMAAGGCVRATERDENVEIWPFLPAPPPRLCQIGVPNSSVNLTLLFFFVSFEV